MSEGWGAQIRSGGWHQPVVTSGQRISCALVIRWQPGPLTPGPWYNYISKSCFLFWLSAIALFPVFLDNILNIQERKLDCERGRTFCIFVCPNWTMKNLPVISWQSDDVSNVIWFVKNMPLSVTGLGLI